MAKTRKVTDQEQLEFYINEVIKRCESEHMKPSDYNLCKFLSISQSTLDRYYRGGKEAKTYEGFDDVLKTLISYREHYYSSMLDQKGTNVAGAIIQLKQPKNGGYTDVPAISSGGATLTLKIDGVGGLDAFK
jgi:hypothetical protein